jgi:uncharacterized cupin superfamily protein
VGALVDRGAVGEGEVAELVELFRHRNSEGYDDEADFSQLGINLTIVGPGEPMSTYHRESDQEDFLVLAGEALRIIEGEERPLHHGDLVHCPAAKNRVIKGAGRTRCVMVAAGARDRSTGPDWGAYTVGGTAIRHDAGAEHETTDPEQACARFGRTERTSYHDGWLLG